MAELITNNNYQDFTLEMLKTPDGIAKLNSILSQLSANISGDTEQVRVFSGVGTPEASVAAGVGSLYMRTDGGADTSVYRKESGSGNTGWVAIKAPASLPLSTANGGLGADFSATAQGNIFYFSATGVISVLGPGTSGQILQTQGAAANPQWVNGGMSLKSTTTFTTVANTGDITFDPTKHYKVVVSMTSLSANDFFNVRINNDTTANYQYVYKGQDSAGTALNGNSTGTTAIVTSGLLIATYSGSPATHFMSFEIMPQWAGTNKNIQFKGYVQGVYSVSGNYLLSDFWAFWNNTSTATTFRILSSGGATFSGKVWLYEYSGT